MLNPKQELFVEHYVVTANATEAAKLAGYSEKTSYSQGQRLLKHDEVKEAISVRMEELKKPIVADAEEVLAYLTSVLRGEETEQVLKGVGEGAQRLVDKEPNIKDRIKAAELLAKRHGLLTDKLDINGAVPVVIANDDSLED